MLHLQESYPKVIVDLWDLQEEGGPYVLGILNMIKKEVEIMGGEIKLCCLRPNLLHHFNENRLDRIFNILQSVEEAKRSFKENSNGD
jgi:anti-anti-sigma regulatory factor